MTQNIINRFGIIFIISLIVFLLSFNFTFVTSAGAEMKTFKKAAQLGDRFAQNYLQKKEIKWPNEENKTLYVSSRK